MECGPTCLAEVMEFYTKEKFDIKDLVKESKSPYKNMDWFFLFGMSALKRGFKVKIITVSTEILDPSWISLNPKKLVRKMKKRIKYLEGRKRKDRYLIEWNLEPLKKAVKFIEAGGELIFSLITIDLLKYFVKKKMPIIVPVNENIFYGIKRTKDDEYDDIRGYPSGHIVVISGYAKKDFIITDSERLSEKEKGKTKRKTDLMLNSILSFSPMIMVVYK